MSQLLKTIIGGYVDFIKKIGILAAVILFFLFLAVAAGYPLWYFAIHKPEAYTAAGIVFLMVLAGSSSIIRLYSVYKNKGPKELLSICLKFAVKLARILFVAAGIFGIVFLFSHRHTGAGIASAVLFIILSGLVFFRSYRST